MSGFRDAEATAAVAGELCCVFRSLHRILGAGAPKMPTSGAVLYFDERSLEHAFHAELLFERLPLRAGFERELVVTLGSLGGGFALLESWGHEGDEVSLFAGYASLLLPFIVHSLDQEVERSSEIADRSLRRAVRLIRSDLDAAASSTRALGASLLSSDDASARAERAIGQLGAELGI